MLLSKHQSSEHTKSSKPITTRRGLKQNFEDRTKREGEHLIWIGYIDKAGYGRLGGKPAYRIAWLLAGNKATPGMDICHTCDRKDCVEVTHLYEGTHYENMQDAKKAKVMGRKSNPKLTAEILKSVLFDISEGKLFLKEIAYKHNISEAYITKIKKGDIVHALSC